MSKSRPRPKAPMYSPKQRMFYVKCKCDPQGFGAGQDEKADLKLSGGFNVLKNNICDGCKEAKSINGACSCP